MKIAKRCVVSGRVQGVFYRSWAQKTANGLGITGWTRNLNTGEVECLLIGDEKVVATMVENLKKGPVAAAVKNVAVTDAPLE